MNNKISRLALESKEELLQNIIPFWNSLRDDVHGGFYGYTNSDLVVDKKADKGVILHARILWFYASCYKTVGGEQNLKNAQHAYDFLKKHCIDKDNGGVFWMISYDGNPVDTMKHTYCQAFYIYALSAFYEVTKNDEALQLALEIFNTIEFKTTDEIGYHEAFDAKWNLIDNEALSENGLMAHRTMNTVLHLIEAYTELYRMSGSVAVKDRLALLLKLTHDKIYDRVGKKLNVFFDDDMNVIGDIHSYGHDIEATWLLDVACDVLGDDTITSYISKMNKEIVKNIAEIAFENNSLNNERENDHIDKSRIWWVQAETVAGFLNAFDRYENEKYLDIALSTWDYIKENVIDSRDGGEWHYKLDEDGNVVASEPVSGPWKCPYHNGRMCLRAIEHK